MINITIKKTEYMYYFLEVSGHANSDEYGKDLVCASVSTLAQTLIQSLDTVAKIKKFDFKIEDGYLSCTLLNNTDRNCINVSNIIFQVFITGINGIMESYPKYLELKVKEVHSYDD